MDGQEGNLQVKYCREIKGLGDLKGICMSRFGDGVEAQGNSKVKTEGNERTFHIQ